MLGLVPGSSSGSPGWSSRAGARGWLILGLHALVVVFILGVAVVFSDSSYVSSDVEESEGLVSNRVSSFGGGGSEECDWLLRNQLAFQRGASTPERMNEVIRQIQVQRSNCVSERWNPVVNVDDTLEGDCFGSAELEYGSSSGAFLDSSGSRMLQVGDLTVPVDLMGDDRTIRRQSGRAPSNNIIVYFSPYPGEGPWDQFRMLAVRFQAQCLGSELLTGAS